MYLLWSLLGLVLMGIGVLLAGDAGGDGTRGVALTVLGAALFLGAAVSFVGESLKEALRDAAERDSDS